MADKIIIDVSEHNGRFNWDNWKTKIDGAILRCGYGKDYSRQDDKQFTRNATQCTKLGIPFGVYLYSYAKSEVDARLEAAHVYRLIRYLNLSMPVFYDIEEPLYGKNARINYYAFEKQLKDFKVGLYTGEYYYNTYLTDVSTDYLWIAKYNSNNGKAGKKPVLKDGAKYQLWQFTSKYSGIDLDANKVIDESIFINTTGIKTNEEIAQEVLIGKWGNGDERKARLTNAGYNYSAVQKIVNQLVKERDS